ncbi:sulfotransferase [Calditrichota bacterium]
MIYIVLGMHKSGTTLIAETLHNSGINMVEEESSKSYYEGNKYERLETSKIFEIMLNSQGKHSLDIIPPFDLNLDRGLTEMNNMIMENNKKYRNWGFKDPRFVFLYKELQNVIPEHKIIYVYRNPQNLIGHYLQYKFTYIKKAFNSWEVYNQCVIDIIKESANATDILILSYEKIITDNKEYQKIEKFIDPYKMVNSLKTNQKKVIPGKKLLSKLLSVSFLLYHKMKINKINDDINLLKIGKHESSMV